MIAPITPLLPVVYPETDGKPMAENTLQFEWIVTVQGGISALFKDRADVFVGGDNFWYPVEGEPRIVQAPDVYVAFGRPRGHRRSYKQWEEGGVAPQVVWEIWSPGNRQREVIEKFRFYERYGVEEYYTYNPDVSEFDVWTRAGELLVPVPEPDGWTSPLLGTTFDLSSGELRILRPDGKPFRTYLEVVEAEELAERERDAATRERDSEARLRITAEMREAELERRNAALLAQLRVAGIDPDV